MAALQFKSKDDILNDILIYSEESGTPVTDWTPGSANRTFWEIVAQIVSEQYYTAQRLLNLFFANSDELIGDYLDRRVLERAIIRKPGSISTGSINLGRSTPAPFDITIPACTMYTTLDKSISIKTSTDVVLQTGQTSISVEASAGYVDEYGNLIATEKGNLIPGTTLIQVGVAIIGIETAAVNSLGFLGGTDTESDDSLRARFLDAIQNPENGGSSHDFEAWACSVPGIVSARCIPLARGAGTLDVIVLSSNGLPSNDLIAQVQAYLNTKRVVDADVLVRAPNSIPIDITLTYYTDSTSSFQDKIIAVMQSYVTSLGVGGSFIVSQLINKILSSITELKDVAIEYPTQNVAISLDSIATLGTIQINRG